MHPIPICAERQLALALANSPGWHEKSLPYTQVSFNYIYTLWILIYMIKNSRSRWSQEPWSKCRVVRFVLTTPPMRGGRGPINKYRSFSVSDLSMATSLQYLSQQWSNNLSLEILVLLYPMPWATETRQIMHAWNYTGPGYSIVLEQWEQ